MKQNFIGWIIFILLSICCTEIMYAQPNIEPPPLQTGNGVTGTEKIEFASSPNPVGSGARAMGMGGAFIAVADDATAASWNPGGLIQVTDSEVSIVGNWFHRIEDNRFGTDPEADGTQSVSVGDINYFSISYPFNRLNRNMVISLNYQHLYEFNREWDFSRKIETPAQTDELGNLLPKSSANENVDYEQTGNLSALGLAYCAELSADPNISFGFSLNFWNDDLFNNKWDEKTHSAGTVSLELPSLPPGMENFQGSMPSTIPPLSVEYLRTDSYSFNGFNANIGLLWETRQLNIGLVLKTPFRADLTHKRIDKEVVGNESRITPGEEKNEKVDMPMSYGIGFAYKFSDHFVIAGDFYRTEWKDFVIIDTDGNKRSPITNEAPDQSDIDATHQVRFGAEYLYYKEKQDRYSFPFRLGVFYDPAPAKGSPDDYYGFTLGTGIQSKYIDFDVAYQYRYGNDVGESILPDADFSQDVEEHTVYTSLIFYFEGKK